MIEKLDQVCQALEDLRKEKAEKDEKDEKEMQWNKKFNDFGEQLSTLSRHIGDIEAKLQGAMPPN